MRLIDADKVPYVEAVKDTLEPSGEFYARREDIRAMPTIKPEPQWIPCSERLPEEDDYKSCIECLDGAVWYFTENGTMGIGYYYESTKEWSTTDDLKTDGKVIAWMPLPEPYAERQEE